MHPTPRVETIWTERLELVPLRPRFVDAMVAGDGATAGAEIGARVGRWLMSDSSHLVQLHVAQQRGEARGFPGLGRAIVLAATRGGRRMIGSVGFHGIPDERGRMELGCRIHPAHRGRGYAAESMIALIDWATASFGVTRFLAVVSSHPASGDIVSLEIANGQRAPSDQQVGDMASLVELFERP